jgi:hypothetical protein
MLYYVLRIDTFLSSSRAIMYDFPTSAYGRKKIEEMETQIIVESLEGKENDGAERDGRNVTLCLAFDVFR